MYVLSIPEREGLFLPFFEYFLQLLLYFFFFFFFLEITEQKSFYFVKVQIHDANSLITSANNVVSKGTLLE